MAVTIVATPGSATANSFETLAEALAYFAGRKPMVPAFEDADDQTALLAHATRVLNAALQPSKSLQVGKDANGREVRYFLTRRTWTGTPTTTTQRLAWPRVGMFDMNGNAIPDNVIPEALKEAQSELAGLLNVEDSTIDNDITVQGITSIKAGSVALTFKDMIERRLLPSSVWDLMPASWFTDEVITYVDQAEFEVL